MSYQCTDVGEVTQTLCRVAEGLTQSVVYWALGQSLQNLKRLSQTDDKQSLPLVKVEPVSEPPPSAHSVPNCTKSVHDDGPAESKVATLVTENSSSFMQTIPTHSAEIQVKQEDLSTSILISD